MYLSEYIYMYTYIELRVITVDGGNSNNFDHFLISVSYDQHSLCDIS